jgi:hypothetical protein
MPVAGAVNPDYALADTPRLTIAVVLTYLGKEANNSEQPLTSTGNESQGTSAKPPSDDYSQSLSLPFSPVRAVQNPTYSETEDEEYRVRN